MQISSSSQVPHRPGPLHQTNKLHKGGRNRRKSSVTSEIKSKSSGSKLANLRREERLNQANQSRLQKREKVLEEKRKLGDASQPPLLVGLLDLHLNTRDSFLDGIRNYSDEAVLKATPINARSLYVVSNRLKMRFKLIALDSANFDETLDIVKTLDIIVILHNPDTVDLDEDHRTALLLRTIHMHCLPSTLHILYSVSKVSSSTPKDLANAKRLLKSRTKEEKVHSIEKELDYVQLFHLLGNCKRQRSLFKDSRPVVETDKVELIDGSLAFTGYLRKKSFSPNSLVHIVGFDDYQIKQIDILPDVVSIQKTSLEGQEVVQTLIPDPMRQETLDQENEIDPMAAEQTWPTAEELAAEEERLNTRKIVKKLPPGTSEYQGAWIPEDESDDNYSDSTDDEEESRMDEDGDEDHSDASSNYADAKEQTMDEDEQLTAENESDQVKMDVDDYDRNFSKEKEFRILDKIREARQDEMFPDEIDTPADVPARSRFARYRGLNSFRTSPWDPQENLPTDYSRIYQFKNFQQTKRRVLNEEPNEDLHAKHGLYVRVHLANVPQEVVASVMRKALAPNLVGLLKYERKMTVMNLLIKRLPDSNTRNPIRSKEELIFYVGFRKFTAKPLFSNHSMSSKFKNERFLRDDVAMVATIYAPITFPPAPVLVFRRNYRGEKELVASGSVLESNPNRMIIKRIRLSGHPFKIHSKMAVIRFMFFNSEDIMYFKPVELITRYNRRGHITEPLGTHGHMKCTFDRKIRSDDCVFMNLYKRVYPKWTYKPLLDL